MSKVSPYLQRCVRESAFPDNALTTGQATPGVDDPETLQRQYDAYELRCAGASFRDIGAILGRSRDTVLADLETESARRVAGLSGRHEAKVAMSVARYEGVILRALNRLAFQDELARQGVSGAGRAAFMDEKLVIEAQERIDRVLGLLRVIPGEAPAGEDATAKAGQLLAAFLALPEEMRLDLLRLARLRKLKNVTPDGAEVAS